MSIFALLKFIVSEYDSCRFSASFWTIFVEPGAAPPVHAKISCCVPHPELFVGILMF